MCFFGGGFIHLIWRSNAGFWKREYIFYVKLIWLLLYCQVSYNTIKCFYMIIKYVKSKCKSSSSVWQQHLTIKVSNDCNISISDSRSLNGYIYKKLYIQQFKCLFFFLMFYIFFDRRNYVVVYKYISSSLPATLLACSLNTILFLPVFIVISISFS